MKLDDAKAHIENSWRLLNQQWERTITLWSDSVRVRFEKDYWGPIESQVHTTQRELDQLRQVIGQARRNVK